MASLFRKPSPRPEPLDLTPVMSLPPRTGIIDIGSNSIRLVVYQGPPRLPSILFNEKVMAGLGRGLAASGALDRESLGLARMALARFAAMAREMEVANLRTVATAAVRDASNGDELIEAARRLGLAPEILSGEQEATGAGMGVLSAIPQADGIVGDLGGGSLELVRVRAGEVLDRASFPLGVLRVKPLREEGQLERRVQALLKTAGWRGKGEGLPLYLVGGSWRSLARLDMHQTGYPLPVMHQYEMPPETIRRLVRTVPHLAKATLKAVPGMSSARVPTLADAAALLGQLLRQLGSATTIVSTFGLREGLLYQALSPTVRAEDPLIVEAREEGRLLGRFAAHGDLLHDWIAPLFADEPAGLARLRHAACLLADVGWRANPDFRAERGIEVALHGSWVAIDSHERALLAQALFTSLGGGTNSPDPLLRLAPEAALAVAKRWGLAMRLGQRLSGGLAGPLGRAKLAVAGDALTLRLPGDDAALYSDTVERRHGALAEALGLRAVLLA